MKAKLAGILVAALLAPSSISSLGAQALLEPPPTSEPAPTGEQPGVLRPVPDVHGRSGQGVAEQHGNDTTSPGGGSTGITGTVGAGTATTGTGADPDALEAQQPFQGQAVAPQSPGLGSSGAGSQ